MNSYSALRTDDVDTESVESKDSASHIPQDLKKRSSFGYWALAICVLCTAINLVTTFTVPFSSTPPAKPMGSLTANDVRLLRRPSQYIGLEKVVRPSPPEPKSFWIYPIVLAPIDNADKSKVFDDDPKRYASQIGTITPEIRRVLVTDTVSTIAQFRAIDFGMESCELNILIPAVSSADGAAISVYRVNETYALDTRTLSYGTRPQRLQKLSDIPINPDDNVHWHRKFACPSESVLSFELACSTATGHSCNLEWWQDKTQSSMDNSGIYIVQHATI
ncbi:hypothetical protein PHLCEN_2v377 [Hermanssonia centrifuga]|uniref:Ubiquitin 3 binding protein But2 C-terminal domain-containing protein n=1 Tax=Hermanssonia centrifuga TaxID=98765 RepID=A0A2R6S693_9APHY|nr:hypothetical protein PHLCEN_2v5821 [Hermanssonia centrifuga]PSS37776.1 hypothetical protein PHLCEN_2v377 [Hermanssonia centrifuga]